MKVITKREAPGQTPSRTALFAMALLGEYGTEKVKVQSKEQQHIRVILTLYYGLTELCCVRLPILCVGIDES